MPALSTTAPSSSLIPQPQATRFGRELNPNSLLTLVGVGSRTHRPWAWDQETVVQGKRSQIPAPRQVSWPIRTGTTTLVRMPAVHSTTGSQGARSYPYMNGIKAMASADSSPMSAASAITGRPSAHLGDIRLRDGSQGRSSASVSYGATSHLLSYFRARRPRALMKPSHDTQYQLRNCQKVPTLVSD
jgi:hypothetical protein